jgi:hypothetical protein
MSPVRRDWIKAAGQKKKNYWSSGKEKEVTEGTSSNNVVANRDRLS